mmetsp:Transcript_5507/g.11575  ORF Transcript_5507/g.11575 Transcript_5507/m.11575 type:complete len:170 (-) Transcript_5507:118-627(-)
MDSTSAAVRRTVPLLPLSPPSGGGDGGAVAGLLADTSDPTEVDIIVVRSSRRKRRVDIGVGGGRARRADATADRSRRDAAPPPDDRTINPKDGPNMAAVAVPTSTITGRRNDMDAGSKRYTLFITGEIGVGCCFFPALECLLSCKTQNAPPSQFLLHVQMTSGERLFTL